MQLSNVLCNFSRLYKYYGLFPELEVRQRGSSVQSTCQQLLVLCQIVCICFLHGSENEGECLWSIWALHSVSSTGNSASQHSILCRSIIVNSWLVKYKSALPLRGCPALLGFFSLKMFRMVPYCSLLQWFSCSSSSTAVQPHFKFFLVL